MSPTPGNAHSPASHMARNFDCVSAKGKMVGMGCARPMKARSSKPGLNIRLYSGSTLPGAEMKSASKNGKVIL